MHIKLLGTRGEIPNTAPYHSKKSGMLIDGQLLLDIGEKSYLDYNPKWIVITHLHPDHAYFMRKQQEEDFDTQAIVYAPENPGFGVQVLRKKIKIGPYVITPIPTHHSLHVLSQGYLIEKGGISILYTGDLVWIDKKYHRLFGHAKIVITDGSFVREGGMVRKDPDTGRLYGHNGIPNLIRLFQPHIRSILFTHFGSWFYRSAQQSRRKLKSLEKKYQVKILIGYDGMLVSV